MQNVKRGDIVGCLGHPGKFSVQRYFVCIRSFSNTSHTVSIYYSMGGKRTLAIEKSGALCHGSGFPVYHLFVIQSLKD